MASVPLIILSPGFCPARAGPLPGHGRPASRSFRATVDLTVEPLSADRSRLTYQRRLHRPRHRQILIPLMVRREAAKEMPTNMATLKRRLEIPS
jgi:hypothetical protein